MGAFFASGSRDTWYVSLNKPFFNPPDNVFAPVWTVLYILMGISFSLIWIKGLGSDNNRKALYLFLSQLGLNVIWPIAFFGNRSPLAGLVVIILLWITIFRTIKAFSEISRLAALLLVPYILWVSFAFLLNGAIFVLNR